MLRLLQREGQNNTFSLYQDIERLKDKYDPDLKKILYFNTKETLISQMYFEDLFLIMLQKIGCKIMTCGDIDMSTEKKDNDDDMDFITEYNNIQSICENEYEILKEDIKYDRSKEKQKIIDKFRYDKLWAETTPEELKAKLFFKYSDVYKQQTFYNVALEKQDGPVSQTLQHEIKRFANSIVDMPMTTIRLENIRKFNDMLELANSQDKKVIEGDRVEKCINYIKNNVNDFNAIYNCNIKLNGNQDRTKIFSILKKAYNQWSGMIFTVKTKDRTNKALSYMLQGDSFYNYIKEVHSNKDEIIEAMNEHN